VEGLAQAMAHECSKNVGSLEGGESIEQEEERRQIIRASILEAMLWVFEEEKSVGERINVIYGILRSLRHITGLF